MRAIGPLNRITARAPGPGADARATMVSSRDVIGNWSAPLFLLLARPGARLRAIGVRAAGPRLALELLLLLSLFQNLVPLLPPAGHLLAEPPLCLRWLRLVPVWTAALRALLVRDLH